VKHKTGTFCTVRHNCIAVYSQLNFASAAAILKLPYLYKPTLQTRAAGSEAEGRFRSLDTCEDCSAHNDAGSRYPWSPVRTAVHTMTLGQDILGHLWGLQCTQWRWVKVPLVTCEDCSAHNDAGSRYPPSTSVFASQHGSTHSPYPFFHLSPTLYFYKQLTS
jgi:hypothetical protein